MTLVKDGKSKKIKLDHKCSKCRKRYSTALLLEEGYAEYVSGGKKSIECPNCRNKEIVK